MYDVLHFAKKMRLEWFLLNIGPILDLIFKFSKDLDFYNCLVASSYISLLYGYSMILLYNHSYILLYEIEQTKPSLLY